MAADITVPPRPTPMRTPTSAPFWEALERHELALQRCDSCASWVHYPRRRCPECLSPQLSWHAVEPAGTVYTFTVARRPTAPPFGAEVPQIIAVVELGNGVRLTTSLTNVDPEQVRIGLAVHGIFERQDDGTTLLRFAPDH